MERERERRVKMYLFKTSIVAFVLVSITLAALIKETRKPLNIDIPLNKNKNETELHSPETNAKLMAPDNGKGKKNKQIVSLESVEGSQPFRFVGSPGVPDAIPLAGVHRYRQGLLLQWHAHLSTVDIDSGALPLRFQSFCGNSGLDSPYPGGGYDQQSTMKIVHSGYCSYPVANDIGLLRVAGFHSSNEVNPIRLPDRNLENLNGMRAIITGWGANSCAPNSLSLQWIDVNIIDRRHCRHTYGWRVDDDQLCVAGYTCPTNCQINSDSGGSLIVEDYRGGWSQVGVVSARIQDGCRYPSLHTRVASYLDWISANTGIYTGQCEFMPGCRERKKAAHHKLSPK